MTAQRQAGAGLAPMNPLHSADWRVEPILLSTVRRLVAQHHYARGGSNTATATHGLIERKTWQVRGATWWIPPTRAAAAACWTAPEEVLALSRLVIEPGVPTNAASFLLARSVRLLEPRWRCLVTWADTAQGHTGQIYRAANWEYLGLSTPTDAWELDGVQVARRAGGHTRTHTEMIELGANFKGCRSKHRFRLVRRHLPRPRQPELWQAEMFA